MGQSFDCNSVLVIKLLTVVITISAITSNYLADFGHNLRISRVATVTLENRFTSDTYKYHSQLYYPPQRGLLRL